MSLARYKQKRHFDKTPEPAGRAKADRARKMEFVVQKHRASHLHYDFRLEMDGVLKSWAVPKGPSLNPAHKRLAMMVEDHPYEYRKFEGTIPKGNYGAGRVIIWDRGEYRPSEQSKDHNGTLLKELEKGRLSFVLDGQKLKGAFTLIKSPQLGENAWLLIKKDDEFASTEDVTKQAGSVINGKRIDEPVIDLSGDRPSAMPLSVKPMLATLTGEAFDDDDWLFEIKWDGYRAIASWDGHQSKLYSRNGLDFGKYQPLIEALKALDNSVVLDGEVVMLDEAGHSRFGWLQNYGRGGQGTLVYYVFDILWCDGKNLTGLPLIERKRILESLLPPRSPIKYSDHVQGCGIDFFKSAAAAGLEGIIAKRCASRYKGQRSPDWLKIKTHLRQEAVIGGFTEPRGSRTYIGALILGVYDGEGALRYVGHVGGGIPAKQLPSLRAKLNRMERKSPPFADKMRPNAPFHWVTPKLICEVSFSEWTTDGLMRQPIFIGLRADKDPKEVKKEVPMPAQKETAKPKVGAAINFTHLNKVFFPKLGYTKGDLIDYYTATAHIMLKYLKDRPHSLLRHPNGINGPSFFQKDVVKIPTGLRTEQVFSESNGKNINYLVCDSTEALLYMVQLGCIEINPWNSRVGNLEKPDWVVLDLDPEKIGFAQVVKVAQVVHGVCEELGIPAYPKTSGKTGIHVFIPLHARYDYSVTKQFGEVLANLVHERLPKITSLERSPAKRQGRIYLDFLQNREGQTLAAPYSVRPTEEATVSTPLAWDEVDFKLKPANYTIKNLNSRLRELGDIWCPVIGEGTDILSVLEKLETSQKKV